MTQERTIKVGLIGCGRISSKHIDSIAKIEGMEIVAICDIDSEKVNHLSKKLNINKTYLDYREMLNDSNVEVVDICTPSGLHRVMAIDALRKGKDVIIEKPIALTFSDAEEIIEVAKTENKLLLPIMQNRFNSAIVFLKKNIDKLGKINFIDAACYWYRPQDYYNDGWHGTKEMDGGVLMNQGIHYIDMIYYLMGCLPKEISALGGTFGHQMECEDVASLNIKFQNDVIASLRANTISFPENFEGSITIFFEKATVRIGGKAMNQIVSWKGEGEKIAEEFSNLASDDIYGDGHLKVLKNMFDIKINGFKSYISGEDAAISVKIINGAYDSMSKKTNIII